MCFDSGQVFYEPPWGGDDHGVVLPAEKPLVPRHEVVIAGVSRETRGRRWVRLRFAPLAKEGKEGGALLGGHPLMELRTEKDLLQLIYKAIGDNHLEAALPPPVEHLSGGLVLTKSAETITPGSTTTRGVNPWSARL